MHASLSLPLPPLSLSSHQWLYWSAVSGSSHVSGETFNCVNYYQLVHGLTLGHEYNFTNLKAEFESPVWNNPVWSRVAIVTCVLALVLLKMVDEGERGLLVLLQARVSWQPKMLHSGIVVVVSLIYAELNMHAQEEWFCAGVHCMCRCDVFNDGDNSFNSAWRFMHDLSFKSVIFHSQVYRSEFSYWSMVLADFKVKLKNADGCSCRSCACTVFNKRRSSVHVALHVHTAPLVFANCP